MTRAAGNDLILLRLVVHRFAESKGWGVVDYGYTSHCLRRYNAYAIFDSGRKYETYVLQIRRGEITLWKWLASIPKVDTKVYLCEDDNPCVLFGGRLFNDVKQLIKYLEREGYLRSPVKEAREYFAIAQTILATASSIDTAKTSECPCKVTKP